ncbi:endonuclease domain of the non-LTR retrotransposon LINE-1 [Elysia marginata]|uniref:Endonuclease domain of the non-LTR retrotransposon LINE-1 n=1 Tax=Elysia marginata TaxID=1093978 RepID=A0AAV4GW80_9GAST|nr:endonuclease domain of the non-LTR retrotransposon LINE-1 [Elysia marginata]
MIVIYTPPDANKQHASKQIADITNDPLDKSPDSVVLITGDFNHQTLEHDLPSFHQYINCPTRGDTTLDLCYGNIAEAYKCRPLPQLGKSDHNMIHLMPKYRPLL